MTSLFRDGKGAVPIGPAVRLTLLALSTAQHREKASIELFNKKFKKSLLAFKNLMTEERSFNKMIVNLSTAVSNMIVIVGVNKAVMCDAETEDKS